MTDNGDGNTEVQDAVSAGRAATGENTATGQAALTRSGAKEIPQGEDRGSKLDTGPIPAADYVGEGQAPVGEQAEPAVFAPNGALDSRMVPSNSGLVPLASVATSPEHANQLREEQKQRVAEQYASTHSRQRLTNEKINSMSAQELRAVAHDRGYDISGAAGKRGTRQMFMQAQNDDTGLLGDDEKVNASDE